ncbi:MAG: FtsW/RodA/SpoVE family cell cycle protein [Bacteroidia bacterium]|nr:FtsW/RodA/SpoVE family cell cycle protein [Bacteroidia bacterium]MCZ2277858.1 FtsW/RodA/SpoVE family cell cycle protein [Bacteroidia bacterium]
MKQFFGTYFKGDRYIWTIVVVLSVISILAVYSSTGTLAYKYQGGNTEYYMLKHLSIILLGFGIMYFSHRARYTFYSSISWIALFVAVPLLVITLFAGTNLNEASRWITLPIINLSFQTSDFAKIALILFIARTLSRNQDNIKDFKSAFLPIILPVLLICGLILPSNFSTAAVLFSTSLVLMFIGRVSMKYIMLLVGTGIIFFILFILVASISNNKGRIETWKNRIENFRSGDNSENYQTEQAKIAVATGGIFGKGPGSSSQRNFLPHPYSDFIYAIIIEEYGMVGGVLVLFLYISLFYRTIMIVRRTNRAFATFLAIGCGFTLVFQALINMAVAVNLFPVTGQPLPMLSMGGTSIWFTSLAIGILLSVSREVEKKGGEEVAVSTA